MINYNNLIFPYIEDNTPDPLEEYIKSFSKLPRGWNFGEGDAPTEEVIERSIKIYKLGKSYGLIGSAFPVGDGEIEISFSYQDHFIDILITINHLEYTYEVGIGDDYEEIEHIEDISIQNVELKLRKLEEMKLCDSLEYFMQEGIIGINEDSKAVVSKELAQGFPSLTEIVWSKIITPQYVTT